MKETYKVKRPGRIVWGDPLYLREYSGEKLKSLIVDIRPPSYCDARVVLEEKPVEEYPENLIDTMTIYLAPKDNIETYMQDMMYESQEVSVKNIGVDTAKYYIRVDEATAVIPTGGDGYWGNYQELFRMNGKQKMLDGIIITIEMPEHVTMDGMRDYLNKFFEDVEQIENVDVVEESVNEQQQNM